MHGSSAKPASSARSAGANTDSAHQSDSRIAEAARLPSTERRSRHVCERVDELELPEAFKAQMAPLLGVMGSVNAQLKAIDKGLEHQAKTHEVAKRLCTAAGVGPVTAISFVPIVDRVERFDNAKQVRAYLGLVPRELSSGEKSDPTYVDS